MLCNCCLWQATVHYALGSQHKHSMTCHTLLTICQMFTHTKSSQEALVSVFTLLGQMYGVRIQVTDPESKELLLQQLNNHVAIKMKLVLSPLRPWQPDSRAHPAEMPHLQHAEEDSETSGDPPADHILLPLAETGDGSSICSIILVITDDKEEQVGAAAAGVEPVPVQQHEEQWYLYQSSNTKSSGTCTSPATQRAVEPVPVQQHGESGTCTNPATQRTETSNLVCHLCLILFQFTTFTLALTGKCLLCTCSKKCHKLWDVLVKHARQAGPNLRIWHRQWFLPSNKTAECSQGAKHCWALKLVTQQAFDVLTHFEKSISI